jgi:hypothetical protein
MCCVLWEAAKRIGGECRRPPALALSFLALLLAWLIWSWRLMAVAVVAVVVISSHVAGRHVNVKRMMVMDASMLWCAACYGPVRGDTLAVW